MKIGVVSDTHLTDKTQELPKNMLDDFKSADMVIHAGDLVDFSVIERLKKVCPKVIAVYGNMDPFEVRSKLPKKEIINVGKFRIGVFHGYGASANLIDLLTGIFKNDKVDIVIFGHSHSGLNQEKDGVIFFNPGSPTDKIYAKDMERREEIERGRKGDDQEEG